MSLSNKQQRYLRSLCHQLNPVVIIGVKGLTDSVINEIDVSLDAHELIKIRVNAEDREERKAMQEQIEQLCEANCVQQIGHILAIYRPRKKNPIIVFPN